LYSVLGKYPIRFAIPQKNESSFIKQHPDWNYECFSDEYFTSVAAYSRMCLSTKFYERFAKYEYMLIYQPDAFVFSDKLMEFCAMGYDYIGAPVWRVTWPGIKGRIGNGGFSLRKIKKFIDIIKQKKDILVSSDISEKMKEIMLTYEDAFWGYCGSTHSIDFSIPNVKVASTFSIACDVGRCYSRLCEDNLPFGCHGWLKSYFYPIMKPYIKRLYQITDEDEKHIYECNNANYQTFYRDKIDGYLLSRIIRQGAEYARNVMSKLLSFDDEYIVWGYGYWGKEAVDICRFIGINVAYIFDTKAKNAIYAKGIPIVKPSEEVISSKNLKIIIASTDYEADIRDTLSKWRSISKDEIFSYLNIRRAFIKRYYNKH